MPNSQMARPSMNRVISSERSVWNTEIKFLKGVGDKLASLFAKGELRTLWDLLLCLPRSYEDRRRFFSYDEMIEAAQNGQVVLGRATIESFEKKQAGPRGRRWSEATAVLDGESSLGVRITFTWFNDFGGSIAKSFPPGTAVVFRGKVQNFRGRLQIVHPDFQKTDKEIVFWERGIVPVYREVSGLSAKYIRKVVAQAVEKPEFYSLPESLPQELCQRLNLPGLKESLRELHFPKTWEPNFLDPQPDSKYYFRVVFEELFMMSLALHFRRAEWKRGTSLNKDRIPKIPFEKSFYEDLLSKLPYVLTVDQEKVVQEIFLDMSLEKASLPMHRLVQGDVGSGKTVVAFMSALLTLKAGYQAALMAPTEILADQHFANFSKMFPEYAHQIILLKGALSEKKKSQIRHDLSQGQYRFVIGTQALLTDSTLFENLALVIIDEQHRFGVEQRLGLKKQGNKIIPHLLVMTATPIPRSLALTLYGDLSLSSIRSKPAGRSPIQTHLLKQKQRPALMQRLRKFLDEGRQIYMVFPLVEESEELDLKDVKNAFSEITAEFSDVSVGLLHGKLKSSEKEKTMQQFKSGEHKILVATTVIEVGVDVPNASVIVIEHAERFGLSQLHQLRGRVGRGSAQSYCVLVGPDRMGPLVEERLRTLEESDDGFYIAEKDLDLRGPGEFLGRRQSGLPGFRVAHILRDLKWMEIAREEARNLLENDPKLEKADHHLLRSMIERWWGGRMELTLSG
jgi:ATP-dependent DNA helicase RecG